MRKPETGVMTPDVCVFVEGTYPYVTGGVSTWLHNLMAHLPGFTFTVCHLSSKPEPGRSIKYQLPANVIGLHEVFLSASTSLRRPSSFGSSPTAWESLERFHDALARQKLDEAIGVLRSLIEPGIDHLNASDFFYSPEAWNSLVERYSLNAPSSPFLDYFWTFRSTHLPLFMLNNAEFPQAKLYHAVSTGYAGYAAALAKLRTGRPLLLTEHGIYTRERDIEIALATWMDIPARKTYRLDTHPEVMKAWWTNMFRFMSGFTYHMADSIVSITQGNQQYQLRDGAQPSKLRLIPNGVDVDRLKGLHAQRKADRDTFTVGFVGRVVPIKDVKTFIQAIKIASADIPGIRAFIIGPTDEDADYFAECQQLVVLLELAGIVRFTGRSDVLKYYPQIDVIVLTSLSEGQPLVVLEANCAGIPVVASDVGACRDLLEGVTAEDRALGPSGLLTLPASSDETAKAIICLWKDETLRQQMAHAGQERVAGFYREDAVYSAYCDLYQAYLQPDSKQGGQSLTWPA